MPADATFDPAEVVAAGLAVVAGLAGDPSLAAGGAGIYRSVQGALVPEIRAGDRATIALPCVRMADKLPALLVVLQDRAILAWKSGVYRKTLHAETVPLSASWGATIGSGFGARQPVKVLTVQWAEHPSWVLAVPSDASTTRFLRTCFVAAPGSG
jgi:hypothetical protein